MKFKFLYDDEKSDVVEVEVYVDGTNYVSGKCKLGDQPVLHGLLTSLNNAVTNECANLQPPSLQDVANETIVTLAKRIKDLESQLESKTEDD